MRLSRDPWGMTMLNLIRRGRFVDGFAADHLADSVNLDKYDRQSCRPGVAGEARPNSCHSWGIPSWL